MSVEAESRAKRRSRPGLLNVPNALSVARLFLGAAALWLIQVGWFGWALVLFLLAAITDTLDG